MKLQIYTDGAARGNPGPAGIGVVICDDRGQVIEEFCKYLGTATNNIAEYNALVAALELAQKRIPCSIDFFLDSELVVQQMRGVYKVKNENLAAYVRSARQLLGRFEQVSFTHIPRERNKQADSLANKAIDAAGAAPSVSIRE
jgi:ribonuclease HI